jgi:hypothetical protein
MTRPSNEKVLTRIFAALKQQQEANGFGVMLVLGDTEQESFAYTVGLYDALGYEFIMTGAATMAAKTVFSLIWTTVSKSDRRPVVGGARDDIMNHPLNVNLRFFAVPEELAYENYTFQVENWHDKRVPIVQIMVPDDNDRFFDDAGCNIPPELHVRLFPTLN